MKSVKGEAAYVRQRTLKSAIHCNGIGLHTGTKVSMTLHPGDPDTGIVFRRTDISGSDTTIPATWRNVVDDRLCTSLGNDDGVCIGSIEHLMAALSGCDIDNAVVEVNGPEVPVMDGSAAPFVFLIECAGVVEQDLVVHCPIDLPCDELPILLELRGTGLIAKLRERQKLEVPGLGARAPQIRSADFDRKVGPLDLVPHSDLVQDVPDGGELALADVLAREALLLEHDHAQVRVVELEEGRDGRAARPAPDDRHIVSCLRSSHGMHTIRYVRQRALCA